MKQSFASFDEHGTFLLLFVFGARALWGFSLRFGPYIPRGYYSHIGLLVLNDEFRGQIL